MSPAKSTPEYPHNSPALSVLSLAQLFSVRLGAVYLRLTNSMAESTATEAIRACRAATRVQKHWRAKKSRAKFWEMIDLLCSKAYLSNVQEELGFDC